MAAHQASEEERAVAAIAESLADMLLLLNIVSPKSLWVVPGFGRLQSTRRRLLAVVDHPTTSAKSQKSLAQGFEEVKRRIELIQNRVFHSHTHVPTDILASIDGVTITGNDTEAAVKDLREHVGHLERDLEGLISSVAAADLSPVSPALSTDD